MKLEVLHLPDCPNLPPMLERLAEITDVPVTTRVIESDAAAAVFGMAGSPTLLVNGSDPFGTGKPCECAVSCRLYRDEGGRIMPAPSTQQLRDALRAVDTELAPDACTLPTAEQPLRVAEFDDLFACGLRGLERRTPTELRLTLDAATEATARALIARESNCCSFFGFTCSPSEDGQLQLLVTVPPVQVDVLDALAARAATAAGLSE